MNLVLLGWMLPSELSVAADGALRGMLDVYPELDPDTQWSLRSDSLYAACMHHAAAVAGPRRYLWVGEQSCCLFDGIAVASDASFVGHDAAALDAAWDRLPERLEGSSFVIRIGLRPTRLELLTDPLGVKELYYRRLGEGWLISNSVELIRRVAGDTALDDRAMSLFLSLGWIAGEQTLRSGVRVIPAAQRWSWSEGQAAPLERSYARTLWDPQRPTRKPRPADHEALERTLIVICRELADVHGELECPLTAGRDSRLLAALLIGGEIPARYYTDGETDGADVVTGKRIATTCGLPHRHVLKTTEMLVEHWETLSRRLLLRCDGMVSLWQVGDVLEDPVGGSLPLRLWGMGGEVARGYYLDPSWLIGRRGPEAVMARLLAHELRGDGTLIRAEALDTTRDYLNSRIQEFLDAGFAPIDCFTVFQLKESLPRWAGRNLRKVEPLFDLFAPLITRPFIEAALSIPVRRRYSEPIHHQLTRRLSPRLHAIPFPVQPWRSPSPWLNYLRWTLRRPLLRLRAGRQRPTFDHNRWVEARRESWRRRCLDQADSTIWDHADRAAFERLTAPTTAAAERAKHKAKLCHVATLFRYASL